MKGREAVGQLYRDAYESLNKHCQEGNGRPTFKLLLDYVDAHSIALAVMGISSEELTVEKVAELRGQVAAWEEIRQVMNSLLTYRPRNAPEGGLQPVFPAMFTLGTGKVEGM